MVVECLYQHVTVFIVLISITIFLNKRIAQVQFYFMHAGVAESVGKWSFFQGKKHSSHLIRNGGSFKNIRYQVSEQCYITQLTCFF